MCHDLLFSHLGPRCSSRTSQGQAFLDHSDDFLPIAHPTLPDFATEQHREFPYAPPTRIHWQGVRPFVYGLVAEAGSEGYREDAEHRFPIRFWTGGRLFGVDPPGVLFLTGSDAYGRDVFSRLLYGGQVSLLTARYAQQDGKTPGPLLQLDIGVWDVLCRIGGRL